MISAKLEPACCVLSMDVECATRGNNYQYKITNDLIHYSAFSAAKAM